MTTLLTFTHLNREATRNTSSVSLISLPGSGSMYSM